MTVLLVIHEALEPEDFYGASEAVFVKQRLNYIIYIFITLIKRGLGGLMFIYCT
jgi:hypothetical protein